MSRSPAPGLADLFGKPSYAAYRIAATDGKQSENVLRFLAQVRGKNTVSSTATSKFCASQGQTPRTPLAKTKLDRWDVNFYTERVRRERFAVDQEALRRYFPSEASVAWMFDLAQHLYGVRFVPVDVPRWHDEVRYYDIVNQAGERIAGAYLDLYPRPGKYNTRVWPVRHGSTLVSRTPIAVLVANLDRQGLNHRELETLLHEFGHCSTLTFRRHTTATSPAPAFATTSSRRHRKCSRVDARLNPWQLMTNHCQDCPAVDADCWPRINQARRFGPASSTRASTRLASFDIAACRAKAWRSDGDMDQPGKRQRRSATCPAPVSRTVPPSAQRLRGRVLRLHVSEVPGVDMASRWAPICSTPRSDGATGISCSRAAARCAQKMVHDFLGATRRRPPSSPRSPGSVNSYCHERLHPARLWQMIRPSRRGTPGILPLQLCRRRTRRNPAGKISSPEQIASIRRQLWAIDQPNYVQLWIFIQQSDGRLRFVVGHQRTLSQISSPHRPVR